MQDPLLRSQAPAIATLMFAFITVKKGAGHLLTDGMNALRGRKCPLAYTPNLAHPQGNPNTRYIQHRCRTYRELTSFLRLSVSDSLRQSAGWPRAALNKPDLLDPDLETAKANQRPPLQALPGQERPTGNGRPFPSRSRRTERRRRCARRDRSQPEIVVALVRTGSARHPEPWSAPGISGHGRRTEPQVTPPSPLPPRTAKQHEAGFEPLLRHPPAMVAGHGCPLAL